MKWLRRIENNKEWDRIITDNSERPKFCEAAKGFLKPDDIDVDKYTANQVALDKTEDMFYDEKELEGMRMTPSITHFFETLNRPMGFPTWFMAGYPDVGKWLQKNHNEFELTEDYQRLEKILEDEGGMNNKALRLLIDYYKEQVTPILECSI